MRLDVRLKSQTDWRSLEEGDRSSAGGLDLRRARLAVEGRLSRHVQFEVERELRDDDRPWRDVFVEVRPLRELRVQAGRFKMPFSLDQTTGVVNGDFVQRSLAASALAPSRDIGVMGHGGLFRNRVRYEIGGFRRGGDIARVREDSVRGGEQTVAGRLVVRPWHAAAPAGVLRSMAVGGAFTTGRVPEGFNSLRVETAAGHRMADPVYVHGRRTRMAAEWQWQPGPASLQGEFIRVSDERRGQGIDNDDLPALVQQGWYVSGTWVVTGESKRDGVEPAAPLFQGGFGAVELAGRVERTTIGSGGSQPPMPGPRAARVAGASAAALTIGVNWYVTEFLKIQANLVRDRLQPPGSSPARTAWTRILRLQLHL